MTARWRRSLRARIGRWSPMYLLFAAERDPVAELRAELAKVTEERDRARLIATTLAEENTSWPECWPEGDAFLRSLGERPA